MIAARIPALTPTGVERSLLTIQLFGSLAILAWIPGNVAKLLLFFALWAFTFRSIALSETVLFLVVSALFTAMNCAALNQGVFFFRHADLLGMPVWEFFMWGFYVLHLIRMVRGPAPQARMGLALGLAIAFSLPFSTISDQQTLLCVTAAILGLSLMFFHEKLDLAYAGYMIVVGALVEYVGVWSGQWGYPGDPRGGVPLWFVTMWGGVGLFTRRLVQPILHRYSARSA